MVRHPADQAPDFFGVTYYVIAAHFRNAKRRVIERGENAHGGGFSRTIGTNEAADRAVWDFERNTVDGLKCAEVAVKIMNAYGVTTHGDEMG
jgi:hypothetical protein